MLKRSYVPGMGFYAPWKDEKNEIAAAEYKR